MRSLLNRLRYSRPFSVAVRPLLVPLDRACGFIRRHVRWDFPINGCEVNYDGVKLVFPPGIGVREYTNGLFWEGAGGFEPLTAGVLKALMPSARTFVDIGSNIGIYAVLARKWNPSVAVHAFEPVDAIHERNVSFHAANNLSAESVHRLACSDCDEERIIHIPLHQGSLEAETTGSSLRTDSWQATAARRRDLAVRCVRLDSFFSTREIPPPSVWKIDVEDHEAAALRGAAETIRRVRPVIVCEILYREHRNRETLDAIASLDYEIWAVASGGVFRVREGDFAGTRPFRDVLLCPRGRAAADRSFLQIAELPKLLSP